MAVQTGQQTTLQRLQAGQQPRRAQGRMHGLSKQIVAHQAPNLSEQSVAHQGGSLRVHGLGKQIVAHQTPNLSKQIVAHQRVKPSPSMGSTARIARELA